MKKLSTLFLIVTNFIPVLGAIFWDWNLFAIMFLYWAENIVVGFYNILRMSKAERVDKKEMRIRINLFGKVTYSNKKSIFILFFLFHYGVFTIIHGIFIFCFFAPSNIPFSVLRLGIVSLFINHGVSYLVNFIGRKEYKRVSPGILFSQPYKRVIVMHLTIVFGGLVAKILGSPLPALLLLVFLKTFIDVISHTLEHKKFSSPVLLVNSNF